MIPERDIDKPVVLECINLGITFGGLRAVEDLSLIHVSYFCAQETAMTPSFYAVHASISLDVVIAASILFCVRSAPLMQRQAVVWLLPAARWTSLVLKCKACQ